MSDKIKIRVIKFTHPSGVSGFKFYNVTWSTLETMDTLFDLKLAGNEIEFIPSKKISNKDYADALARVLLNWTKRDLKLEKINPAEFIRNGGFVGHIKHHEQRIGL